jgi:hypothetical protein
MTTTGRATFVGAVEPAENRPQSIAIVLAKQLSLVSGTPVGALGITLAEGVAASAEFAKRLFAVGEIIADQERAALAGDEPGRQTRLRESITLSEQTSNRQLDNLREVGVGIRVPLEDEFVNALRFHEFLRKDGGPEPALTFQEDDAQPPVLWDMFCEGRLTDPLDWRAFWGFRVPISHWRLGSRTARVTLRSGLFAATNEELCYAGSEVDHIATKLQLGARRRTMADYFREYVRRELGDQQMPSADIDAWLAPGTKRWLSQYLDERCPPGQDPPRWKRRKIVEMFTGADFVFDVLHFACHAAPENTAFLSELQFKVGGEGVVLPAGLISSDMPIKLENASSPGPLVFLNACSTAEPGPGFQQAGFPKAWIRDRGAVAVLGTVCPVPDYFAHVFALKFYENLFGLASEAPAAPSATLGAAFLATRRYFMEHHRNPLGLAYVLYADKDARLATYTTAGAA